MTAVAAVGCVLALLVFSVRWDAHLGNDIPFLHQRRCRDAINSHSIAHMANVSESSTSERGFLHAYMPYLHEISSIVSI